MAGSAGGAMDRARSKEEKVSTGKSSEMVEMHKQDTDTPAGQHVITPTPSLAHVFTLSSARPTTVTAAGCYAGTAIRTVRMERNTCT